jgi:hypothetical protein
VAGFVGAVVVVVTVFAFVTMVVGVSVVIGVAVSGFFETGSSSELGGALSHLMRKCLTNVDQEVRTVGELLSSSSYQYSASKSDLQLR